MKNHIPFILFFLLMPFVSYSKVTVVTYNMAQLKKTFDLVACTKKRIGPQIEAMFFDQNSAPARGENFAYLLQEVFNKRAFEKIQEAATFFRLNVYPENYDLVKNNGLVIVSNMPVLEAGFSPFSKDSRVKRGILYSLFELPSGDKLGVANTHTVFSKDNALSDLHKQQFQELSLFVRNNEDKSDHFVIGGDFNIGPEVSNLKSDITKNVWEKEALPIFEISGVSSVKNDKSTWDGSANPLIKKPTFLIKLFNLFSTGRFSWSSPDTTLDHIFTSKSINVLETEIVFDERVRIFCHGRSDREGKSTLSDHYGVKAVLDVN